MSRKMGVMAGVCGAWALSVAAYAQDHPLSQTITRPAVMRFEPSPSPITPAEGKIIPELIADLGADDYETRERAMLALARLPGSPEDIVRQIPDGVEWTPERRSRMESVLWSRFQETPRAGLGTGFTRDAGVSGVALGLVMPNFPASEFLKPQDVIVEADGMPTTGADGQSVVRATIISRDPGETLPLTIMREGRRMALRVPLGRYSDLSNPSNLDPLTLEEAWLLRRDRIGVWSAEGDAEPGAVNVSWGGAWPQQLVVRRTPGAINVLAGGISGANDDLDRVRRKTIASSQQVNVRQLENLMVQRDRFLRMISDQRDEAEKHRLRLKDPSLPDDVRSETIRRMEAADTQADRLQELLRQLMEQNGLP